MTTESPTHERIPITQAQADLLLALDREVRAAQERFRAVTEKALAASDAVLAGAGVAGRPVKVERDVDPPVLVVEVPADDGEG